MPPIITCDPSFTTYCFPPSHYIVSPPLPSWLHIPYFIFFYFRIDQVAEDVYSLALSCFHVPIVISSCVCFLELLGLSSYKLRVDVNVANVILRHSSSLQEEAGHKSHIQALGILIDFD